MGLEIYTKQQLIRIIEEIGFILQDLKGEPSFGNSKSDLTELIGSLPFLLLDEKIFERNLDIARFAAKLDIIIPTPEKKKKEDIIGRVIAAVSKFDRRKISELNHIVNELNSSKKTKTKNNFFNDWEDAIKNISF